MAMAIFSSITSRIHALMVLLTDFFAPRQALLALYGAAVRASGTPMADSSCTANIVHSLDHAPWRLTQPIAFQMQCEQQKPPRRPAPVRLKIVRTFEPGAAPSCAGRMVISGRMTDVCAELDRMAQRAIFQQHKH